MRKITVDCRATKGKLDHFFNNCISAGRAGEMLRKIPIQQLNEVHAACGFRYLRFHGILCDEMGVYRENPQGNPIYNWQYIDMVYDEILTCGMKPFVELSFMPESLASGTKHVFWWKANVTPPKSYKKWQELITHLVEHWTLRYGKEEVKNWLFEIWNEPNHPSFFSAGIEEYFHMYDVTANAIKKVCPDYHVGGPATAGNAWVSELIEHCCQNQIPLDFISTHTYGVRAEFDKFGKKQVFLRDDPNGIITDVLTVSRKVKQSLRPDLPIHYTEWNSSFGSGDPLHDSYIQASYILYHIRRLSGLVSSMSYWTFTDILEENGIGPRPLHGGYGLMSLQSFRKPAFYAYYFLNQLGDIELLNNDSDSFACKQKNNIQILLWDYKKPKQDSYNSIYFSQDLKPSKVGDIEIQINNMEKGNYQLNLFQVGYGVNDIRTEYLHDGFKDLPTREETHLLKEKTAGLPIISEVVKVSTDGNFRYMLPLREYDCYLLCLTEKI